MKVIKPSVEVMRTGLETEFVIPEQFIEKVGRTCYKSEDKITEDSAAKFVGNLIKRGHEAMIEHWNLIFKTDAVYYEIIQQDWTTLITNGNFPLKNRLRPYLRFSDNTRNETQSYIISGNMRAWRDYVKACVEGFGFIPRYLNGLIRNYSPFFPEFQDHVPAVFINNILIPVTVSELLPSERRIHQDITIKFICDRGVSHEIVRHRVASFAQESTRYCNYSSDKFGKEITVIAPSWCEYGSDKYDRWKLACIEAEIEYFHLTEEECCVPQEARSVLPNSLKTEVIVTMNIEGWDHFFELRCAPTAHPDMQVVAKMAKEALG